MNSLTCTVGLTAVGKHDLDHVDLHPLREGGTENYLWWAYDKLEDLRPVLNDRDR